MSKSSARTMHVSPEAEKHPASRARMKAATQSPGDGRERMIAEAAYYLAEHRGFQGGDPLEDWLRAEAEIDHRLLDTRSH